MLGGRQGVAAHLDGRDEQDRAEEQERPRERGDQLGAEGDEHPAQHERAGDADEQHPLLQLARHREGGQQQEEDEQVVDRQRLLDEVAGVVLQAAVTAVLLPDPDPEASGMAT